MVFAASAIAGGIIASDSAYPVELTSSEVYRFGRAMSRLVQLNLAE